MTLYAEIDKTGGGGKWAGFLTAVSSVSHVGETLGTVSYLRREKILSPAGGIVEIPVISGNSLRGRLRDISAELWWRQVGRPQLPLAVANAIWSGGSLTRASGEILTGKRLMETEDVCPVINVYGGAGGGRLIDGTLNVSKVIPVCKETSHLFSADAQETIKETQTANVSFWDLLQIEHYTRDRQAFPSSEIIAEGLDGNAPPSSRVKHSEQMRYGVETFIPGTMFHVRINTRTNNPAGLSLLVETLATYQKNAHLGGKTSVGHGDVSVRWYAQPEWFTGSAATFSQLWRAQVGGNLTLEQHKILARLQ